jgi:hypothetical protein
MEAIIVKLFDTSDHDRQLISRLYLINFTTFLSPTTLMKRSILEQQIKTKRHQAPHIRASDLQIMRSDGSKDGILAYNGNVIQLFNTRSCED